MITKIQNTYKKVQCINNDQCAKIRLKGIYKVLREKYDMYIIQLPSGDEQEYYKHRFIELPIKVNSDELKL